MKNKARPSAGLCFGRLSVSTVLPARREVVPGPSGISGPSRALVGALAEVADALAEAAPGLVEVGGADVVALQVVVEPAEEVGLVAFLDMVMIGAHDIDVRRLAVQG